MEDALEEVFAVGRAAAFVGFDTGVVRVGHERGVGELVAGSSEVEEDATAGLGGAVGPGVAEDELGLVAHAGDSEKSWERTYLGR